MLELEVDTGGDFPATVRVDVEGRVTHVEVDDQTDEVYATWAHFCEAVGIEDPEAAFEKVEDQIDPDVLERVKTMDLDNADDVLAECVRQMAEPVKTEPVKARPVKTVPKVKTAPVKAVPKAKKTKVPPKAKTKKTANKTPKKAKARKR
jgi:hypothetical protein